MTILNTIKKDRTSYVQIQCDNDQCNQIFERGKSRHCKPKFDHRMLKTKTHYCCAACVYTHRVNMEESFKTSPKHLSVNCMFCKKDFKKWKASISNTNHIFCSKRCYGDAISSNMIEMNIKMTQEVKDKIGTIAKERHKTNGHPWTGRNHNNKTKEKLSMQAKIRFLDPTKNPMFGKHHSQKSKEVMSEKHSLLILNGKKQYGNNHLTGYYESIKTNIKMFYRSNWELECMKWLDKNQDVKSYEYEPFRIEYFITGEKQNYKRYYIPDFLIEFIDNHKELWEIKPKQFIDNEKTRLKTEAARNYCKKNCINTYKLLTKENLQTLKIL